MDIMDFLDQTPREIDGDIINLLNRLNPNETPEFVSVEPEPYSEVGECFPNVSRKVQEDGGSICLGWQIWKGGFLVEGEFHAVWRSPSGALIDITPKDFPTDRILFLPDSEASYDGDQVDNVRIPIGRNELAEHFIALCEGEFRLKNKGGRAGQYGLVPIVGRDVADLHRIEMMKMGVMKILIERGDVYSRCFCGRDTYINCHGRGLVSWLRGV